MLMVSACDDHLEDEVKTENDEVLISRARNFFEGEVLDAELAEKNLSNYRVTANRSVQWEKAYVKDLSSGKGVVVPIRFLDPVFLKRGNEEQHIPVRDLSYFLISKGQDGRLKPSW
jgi:hypothetical protein